ncbi:MAG: alpha/beta hydrolase [Patescibacteria group bacterium]
MVQKKIIINDSLVNYYQSDELDVSNTIVFLHGWGVEATIFQDIYTNIDSWVAIDWPGFGGSQIPPVAWRVLDYANFLHDFLQKLKIDNPLLIGHSFGGRVIIKYCAQNLGVVKKVILIDSAGVKDDGQRVKWLEILAWGGRWLKKIPGIKKVVKSVGRQFQSSDYRQAGANRATMRKVIGEDLQVDMKKIKVPATIIWGEDDQETPLADGLTIHRLIVGSKFYSIKQAGHFPFVDQRESFMQILAEEIPRW